MKVLCIRTMPWTFGNHVIDGPACGDQCEVADQYGHDGKSYYALTEWYPKHMVWAAENFITMHEEGEIVKGEQKAVKSA